MKNYVQLGDNLTLPAPAAIASGAATLIGSIFGVASTDAAQGEDCSFVRVGVFNLPKVAGTAITPGAKLYWDAAAQNVTTVAGGPLIGAAATGAAAADPAVAALLTGQIAA